jgi:hypothetical protein
MTSDDPDLATWCLPTDPFIKPFLPTRLELMNGARLKSWLIELTKKAEK